MNQDNKFFGVREDICMKCAHPSQHKSGLCVNCRTKACAKCKTVLVFSDPREDKCAVCRKKPIRRDYQ